MSGILIVSIVWLHYILFTKSELQRIQIPEISHQIQDIIMQEILNAMTRLNHNIV